MVIEEIPTGAIMDELLSANAMEMAEPEPNNKDLEYWAAAEIGEVVDAMVDRTSGYYDHLETSGRSTFYRRCWFVYYQALETLGSMVDLGVTGDYIMLRVPMLRSVLKTMLNLVGNQEIRLEVESINTDSEVLGQAVADQSILDYYVAEEELDSKNKWTLEVGLVLSEAYTQVVWNPQKGGQAPGLERFAGDIDIKTILPWNVIRDPYKMESDMDDWFIVREFRNKYSVAAMYLEALRKNPRDENARYKAEQILSAGRGADRLRGLADLEQFSLEQTADVSDDIVIFTLYHKPTPALPAGRIVSMLDNEFVIFDGPNNYGEIPVYRLAESNTIGSSFAYSVAFDLLGPQEMLDMLYSTIATNQVNHGVSSIAAHEDANVITTQLAGGNQLIRYGGTAGAPVVLELLKTPAEIFNHADRIERIMGVLPGVSNVRPQEEGGVESGSALALKASQALQSVSSLDRAYIRLNKQVGNAIIRVLQNFATTEREIFIVGKNKAAYLKKFKGEDLKNIQRVRVNIGSPLGNSKAGKAQILNDLMQLDLIKSSEDYFLFMDTGRLDISYDTERDQLILIAAEDEAISRGEIPTVRLDDDHVLHIRKHRNGGSNPDARKNESAMSALDRHEAMHIKALMQMDPTLAGILNQPILGGPPAVPGGAPPPGAAPGEGMSPTTPPPEDQAAPPKLPEVPPGTPENLAAQAEKLPVPPGARS